MTFRSPLRRYEPRPIRLPACVTRRRRTIDRGTRGPGGTGVGSRSRSLGLALAPAPDGGPMPGGPQPPVWLATLPDDTRVYGALDTDRTPLYVYADTPDWSACATVAGHFEVVLRTRRSTVEVGLDLATRWRLHTFLSGNTLDRLLVYANLWEHLGTWRGD